MSQPSTTNDKPDAKNAGPYNVAVIGGTGYGGAELIRLLLAHPQINLARVTSIDEVGKPLESVHQNLFRTGLKFENIPPVEAAKGMDLVILALPHKVSAKLAPELKQIPCKIVDLSGDFRLRDAKDYANFYGGDHPYPEELGNWVYGLPELHRDLIADARRVASPGCFATTIALGLLPLAAKGWLRGQIQTVACTGSSGSGAYARAGTHHPLRANNLQSYKPLNHQHTPEIEQTLRDAGEKSGQAKQLDQAFAINFVPVSAPLTRGILANSFVSLPEDIDERTIWDIFSAYYEDSAFVRVLDGANRTASVVAVKGSMWVDLSLSLGTTSLGQRQLVVSTATDNLVKGGAGQAIQSMNMMLQIPEKTGIDAPALWP